MKSGVVELHLGTMPSPSLLLFPACARLPLIVLVLIVEMVVEQEDVP